MPATLVLTRAELRRCVDLRVLATELRGAIAGSIGDQGHRIGVRASETVTAMVLVPGTAAGVPAYSVKVHAKNPARRPAVSGVICLHDQVSGDLLAIMDSGWLTAVRTGAGAALGADQLARPGAGRVGVIGAGAQGRAQLDALVALRQIVEVRVHDTDPVAARALAEYARRQHELDVQVSTRADIASSCDLLLVATWATTPVLFAGEVAPGTHITSLGADEPGKSELDPVLLAEALVTTDDQGLAAPVLPRTDTTLAQVLRGEHPGRESADQITVYSPVGLPLQDCVVAWHAYRRATAAGLGTSLHLEDGQ